MADESPAGARRDFFDVAHGLSLISEKLARELGEEAAKRKVPPAELVLHKGLLSAVQVDIVETLLHPNDIVPGYEILDVIGKGGMGVVYRARQQNLDRIVALKTILIERMADRSTASRFEQEAVAVARLRHPHIVGAFDFGRHEGRLYFVMELVDGEDLDAYIARHNSIEEPMAWGLARQVAAGLAHAAHEGVVHRDIKPANLLLVEAPEGFPLATGLPLLKIADFGLARLNTEADSMTRLTRAGSTVGSPHYMSPEQLSEDDVDFRTDIYSLGATVFHMLSGELPFAGMTIPQIFMEKLKGGDLALPQKSPSLSSESVRLVADMMKADREIRISDYTELLARIDALLGRVSPLPKTTVMTAGELDTRITEATATTRLPQQRKTSWNVKSVIGPVVIAILLLTLGLFGVLIVISRRPSHDASRPPTMVSANWSKYLFDGQDLNVWLRKSTGNWIRDENEDGARVLSGRGGMVRRSLVRTDLTQPRPLEYYRLTLEVDLHEASAVEIHVEIEEPPRKMSLRKVVRITPEEVLLCQRAGDDGPLKRLHSRETDQVSHLIHIERRRSHMLVMVDQKGFPPSPIGDWSPTAEFRLAVAGGPAWFSNILVEELVPRRNLEPEP